MSLYYLYIEMMVYSTKTCICYFIIKRVKVQYHILYNKIQTFPNSLCVTVKLPGGLEYLAVLRFH